MTAQRRRVGMQPDQTQRMVEESFELLVRIQEAAGISRSTIRRGAAKVLQGPRDSAGRRPKSAVTPGFAAAQRLVTQASNLVSEWRTDPDYVDGQGTPRPLPKTGRYSIAALARRVGRGINVEQILRLLIETRTVERIGSRFRLLRPWVRVLGTEHLSAAQSLRLIVHGLRAAAFYLKGRSQAPGFQRMADDRVPVSQLPAICKFLERHGMRFLRQVNRELRSARTRGKKGEALVWTAVNLQMLLEDEPEPTGFRRPRTKSLVSRHALRKTKLSKSGLDDGAGI